MTTRRSHRRRSPRPRTTIARAAGFDTGSYPGDAAIKTWAASSDYAFVGYYFDAPCHTTKTFRTWSGKFPVLKAAGFGLALVYVGLQQDGCGKASLSRSKGLAHGMDTAEKFTVEGFPPGAVVFLDVEHYNGTLSPAMRDYVQGWLSAILTSGVIRPGIYCPASKANEILRAARPEFTSQGLPEGAPVFWIVKVSGSSFDPETSVPADCGVPFASIWQGRIDIGETHGGVTIGIDQNVADSRDPSGVLV